jgi:hypothetical protein
MYGVLIGLVLVSGAAITARWLARRISGAPPRDLELHAAATLGSASAPLTLVYYTDLRCAECRAFATNTFPELRRRYVDSGKLRIVIRDVALDRESALGAMAARCAGEFGKYWAFHDSLSSTNDSLTVAALTRIAAQTGVPTDPFDRCMASGRYASSAKQPEMRRGPFEGRVPLFVLDQPSHSGAQTVIAGRLSIATIDSVLRHGMVR